MIKEKTLKTINLLKIILNYKDGAHPENNINFFKAMIIGKMNYYTNIIKIKQMNYKKYKTLH